MRLIIGIYGSCQYFFPNNAKLLEVGHYFIAAARDMVIWINEPVKIRQLSLLAPGEVWGERISHEPLPARPSVSPASFPGIVVDESHAQSAQNSGSQP